MHPADREWTLRPAVGGDPDFIQGLLDSARWQHRHLDWLLPLQLLGRRPFTLAMDQGLPVACLACPPEPPGVTWVRLFALASGYQLAASWEILWRSAEAEAIKVGARYAAALCLQAWLPDLLVDSGFAQTDSVDFLSWAPGSVPNAELPDGVTRRTLLPTDLTTVLNVDNRAFEPIWRHSLEALSAALAQSTYSTVVVTHGSVIGYQISTASSHGGHLARLAVLPSHQGRGLATALVVDVLRHFRDRGLPRVTVNTQGKNQDSHALYGKLGFEPTGQSFPVYLKNLPAQ
jgi:ribosomal protein S18 acetylase RimI-like enzyme